ncbi:MAG: DNA (cytosine-5)-methyltransferase 1 [Glaciecola sp.]
MSTVNRAVPKMYQDKEIVFKLGELFSGPGGMALGAKLAAEEYAKAHGGPSKIEHIWGVDLDVNARNTYDHNLPGVGVCMDANDFVNDANKSGLTISCFEKINALAFGFPCNDFSLVGEQKGFQGKFGNLYKAGVKAIEKANPLFFVAENVSGIHSANSDAAFYKIIKELENAGCGYRITTHLFKFEEYGVPQARHRYIIVGIRNDQNLIFRVPSPASFVNTDTSCSKALKYISSNIEKHEFAKTSDQVKWRLIFTPPGSNAWKLDELVRFGDEALLSYIEKIPWYEEKIKPLGDLVQIRKKIEYCRLHVKTGSKMSHIYKRLNGDKPSYTITGSGGGGTHVYHWEEPRALVNRERAALQTFPPDFSFIGNKEQVRKQIGMAVPPLGAKIIFKAILDTFCGNFYESLDEPSYTLMSEEKFIEYRASRYINRLRGQLRKQYEFDNSAFNKIRTEIETWINKEVSIQDAIQNLVDTSLIPLKKIEVKS